MHKGLGNTVGNLNFEGTGTLHKKDISFHSSWRNPDTGYGTGRKTIFGVVF